MSIEAIVIISTVCLISGFSLFITITSIVKYIKEHKIHKSLTKQTAK
jgi:hypothetical protein